MIYKIGVKFDNNNKIYYYKYDEPLFHNEKIVVESHNGYNLVKVCSVDEWFDYSTPSKWIVSRIDDRKFQERRKQDERDEKLLRLETRKDRLERELDDIRSELRELRK